MDMINKAERQYFRYYIVGGNPDGSGGGYLAGTNSSIVAAVKHDEFVKQGYHHVKILTSAEFWGEAKA